MVSSGKKTVAIVNDEASLAALLKFNLEAAGYEVRCYANTADALELLDKPADVAFLDKSNRPFDGIELYSRLRAGSDMPIIFLSAWADTIPAELLRRGLPEADAYVICPFALRNVTEALEQVLRPKA